MPIKTHRRLGLFANALLSIVVKLLFVKYTVSKAHPAKAYRLITAVYLGMYNTPLSDA